MRHHTTYAFRLANRYVFIHDKSNFLGGIRLKRWSLLGLFFIFILLVGCNESSSNDHASDKDLVIFTSIYPIQYVVEQIAGKEAIVESVYPPGVDAHTYEPTSKEITTIATADAFIYLGAGMESFAESTAEALKSQEVHFVEIGAEKTLFNEDTHEHHHDEENNHELHHGDLDPHIWLDPIRMIKIGETIKDTLIELHPESKEIFTENFAILKENMLTLDQEFNETLQNKQRKQIIVTHAAYGYWEERYGLEQISISGVSSTDEPSQKELAEIAEQAKKEELKYVIFEQNSSNQVASIIQEHIGAQVLYIHNLETLTEEDIKNGEDYLSLMQANLKVLDQATK